MRSIARCGINMLTTTLLISVLLPTSSANATTTRLFARIVPSSDYSASGTVYGGVATSYTVTLTNAGVQQAPTATTGIVADSDVDSGNPAIVSVRGGFVPLNGHVTYVLTWTGVAGSSGSLPVTCKTVLGEFSCDGPTEVELIAG